MVFHGEPRRCKPPKIPGAGMDIENPFACQALEMMVMPMTRRLEAAAFTRQVHRLEFTLLHQRLDVAIHRGQTQPGYLLLSRVQYFLRQQRPFGLCDGLSNGAALASLSFHPERLADSAAVSPPFR